MISRKENLLIRPWQQRKFENHRRKVQSALPAIDTSTPPYRTHVSNKLKKRQKENERCKTIERDNLLLLQKLDCIMKSSRIDNSWKTSQPNFLNRIALYSSLSPKMEATNYLVDSENVTPKTRKSRCCACMPTEMKNQNATEERIPWEQSRKCTSKFRSKSVPVKKAGSLPTIEKQLISTNIPNSNIELERHGQINIKKINLESRKKELSVTEPQSILLTRGSLKLLVNFPSDTVVKFQRGNVEKLVLKEICHCKNFPLEHSKS